MLSENLINLIFLFFVFSVLGWMIEVSLKFIDFGRFVNRGFLIGPYCPIYGLGSVLIILVTQNFQEQEHSLAFVFLVSLLVCGLVEYLVSYFLEVNYHARWWDYSNRPMNLNGRIWIGNLVLFGLGGLAIDRVFKPWIMDGLALMPPVWKQGLALCIVLVMLVDLLMSYFVMKLVKVNVEGSKADNTQEIRQEMKVLVTNKNILYHRFINAYPDVKYRTDRIKAKLREFDLESKRIKEAIEENIDLEKAQLKADLEPTNLLKTQIIQRQGDLIGLLESGQDPEAVQALKEEIQDKKEILNRRRRRLNLEEIR
ncbi:MAG: putative ABC transporter permease [Peptoniphilus sp. oral taxon 375]|nr:putative ABC transporter permease [Peptoniphilus sp. oral taxon 375]